MEPPEAESGARGQHARLKEEPMAMTIREINKLVEDYIGTTSDGYLSHFSYSKHEKFYHLYCDVEVDVPAYRSRGHSTRTAFMQILKDVSPQNQAKIIRGTFAFLPPPETAADDSGKKRLKVYEELLVVAERLEAGGQVSSPVIAQTSEVVYEALKDAELLLASRGPKNAVDRAHTALHGYLKQLCLKRGETLPKDASLTDVFKVLRERFPEFATTIPHDSEAKRVFGSLSSALDSLNTIRNRGTLAHPNALLLEPAEAMLYVNLSRAVLSYIEAKTNKKKP